jgi:hypothetical protein
MMTPLYIVNMSLGLFRYMNLLMQSDAYGLR